MKTTEDILDIAIKNAIDEKVRKNTESYLKESYITIDTCNEDYTITDYLSDNYDTVFEFDENEINFIEENDYYNKIDEIISEVYQNYLENLFYYDENRLTGAYVGIDHIICDKEYFYNHEDLENCDTNKYYVFQMHNNADLDPFVLFAIFESNEDKQAINCALKNDAYIYHDCEFMNLDEYKFN